MMCNHAGWIPDSMMPRLYLHYFGNESSESLLQAHGIESGESQSAKASISALKPRECGNCGEQNKPDARFCSKCKFVLTRDAYDEVVGETADREKEFATLKEKMDKMESRLNEKEDKKAEADLVSMLRTALEPYMKAGVVTSKDSDNAVDVITSMVDRESLIELRRKDEEFWRKKKSQQSGATA
jgi:hypothetical protein